MLEKTHPSLQGCHDHLQGLLDFLILYTQRYKKMKLEWQFQFKEWDDPTKRIY